MNTEMMPAMRIVESLVRAPAAMTRAGDDGLPRTLNSHLAAEIIHGHVPVIFADEVGQSLEDDYAGRDFSLFMSDIRKWPRPMPPFHQMWIETNHVQHVSGKDIHATVAMFLQCTDFGAEDSDEFLGIEWNLPDNIAKDVTASIKGLVYYQNQGPQMQIQWLLGPDYQVLHNDRLDRIDGDTAYVINKTYADSHLTSLAARRYHEALSEDDRIYMKAAGLANIGIAMKTCSLMNCSNVHMIHKGELGEHMTRKQRKATHIPSIRYHVLRVKVGTELRDVYSGCGTGLTPLHEVRGHFRDYSRGPGLFGRYQLPAVWVPQHMRGNPEMGAVVKDYEMDLSSSASVN